MKTREVIVLTPTTYDELKDAIAEKYQTLSRQLQKIARFVLEYPEDMALETVAVICQSDRGATFKHDTFCPGPRV